MTSKLTGAPRPSWPRGFSRSHSNGSRRGVFWAVHVACALAVILAVLRPGPVTAQIQQAWVAKYNNGTLNGTNQAVKMALDATGNIYITGFSQNTNTNLGYVTIKYAPNGNQLWASRFDSTNYPSATPSALVLDNSNNVIVTGSALTVKYDPNGTQLWTAPYNGSAIAIDNGGNPIVTGMASTFKTVKLSPTGSNLWQTAYSEPLGPVWSQAVLTDKSGNAYVAGSDTYECFKNGCYEQLLIVKYGTNGNQLWSAIYNADAPIPSVHIGGAALDGANSLYLLVSFGDIIPGYETFKYSTAGSLVWNATPDIDVVSRGNGLVLDTGTNVLLTGTAGDYYPDFLYGSFKLNSGGSSIWTNYYPQSLMGVSAAASIAVDTANNSYITGYSPGTYSGNDIVTIKYDPNGNQIWLQRYNGPGNGNDAGNAIAVDKDGNVYVTGYETTAAGGREIVTIKYSPPMPPINLQRHANGTVILQAQGLPGESFDIQASADLINWLDLGSVLADTNGLMQFDDTNAPTHPARFYITSPQ